MKKILISIIMILALSVPVWAADVDFDLTTGTTFVLTNENGLIDDLINKGYGDYNLYQVLQVLQPYSNGVISTEFLEKLAACPAGSEIFSAGGLSTFAASSMNPIGINSDGTLIIVDLYGNQYYGVTGYSTTPDAASTNGQRLFTYATGEDYYIDTGSSVDDGSGVNYKAFAIAWSMPTSIVLSNEGGLIDELVAAGYGDYSLYDTLVALQPQSGGMITDAFLKALKYSSSDSEVFTEKLSAFTSVSNNPLGTNSDGSLAVFSLYGKDFFGETGYKTYKANQAGVGLIKFTAPLSSEYLIDTGLDSSDYGGSTTGGNYKAIGIIWSK